MSDDTMTAPKRDTDRLWREDPKAALLRTIGKSGPTVILLAIFSGAVLYLGSEQVRWTNSTLSRLLDQNAITSREAVTELRKLREEFQGLRVFNEQRWAKMERALEEIRDRIRTVEANQGRGNE